MASDDAHRANAQRPSLVGRDEELTRLADMADLAVEHGAQMVLLSGDAGIGKSTLTAEFLDRLAETGWGCHIGHCIEFADRPLPFAPVVTVLRSVLLDNLEDADDVVAHHREDLSGLLPELTGGGEGPASMVGDVDRLFDAIAATLTRASRYRPLAVLVEDVHWADSATRDLLASLVHTLGRARVLLLVTERSGALSRSHPLRTWLAEQRRFPTVHSIELEGLNRAELEAQAVDVLGREPDRRFVDELHNRTEGNPYFAYELLVAHDRGSDALPSSLRDFLTSRLERFTPAERELLRAVAVGGGVASHKLLVAMLPDLAVGDIVRSLFDSSILVVEGSDYGFGHGLMREAILAEVLPFEVEDLHRRAAEALEALHPDSRSMSDAVELAIHWASANVPDKTLATSVAAGTAAAGVAAYDTASDMALQALAVWDLCSDPERLAGLERDALVVRSADWLATCYRGQEAVETISAVTDDWGRDLSPGRRARLFAIRATIEFDLGDPALAGKLLDEAEALVGDEVSPEAAQVHHRVSNHALRLGRIHPARESAERTIAIASEVGPRVELVEASSTLALAIGVTEDRDEGIRLAREARALALESGFVAQVARAYRTEWAILYFRDGRTEASFVASREGLGYTEKHCGPRARADFRVDLALGYVEAGRLTDAEPFIKLLLDSEVDELRRLTVYQTAGLRSMGVGDLAGAERFLEVATELADTFQSADETGYNRRIRAELARRQGRLAAALTLVDEALELQLASDNLTFTRETIVEKARIVNACLAADHPGAPDHERRTRRLVDSFDGPGPANEAMKALMELEVSAFTDDVTTERAEAAIAAIERAGFLYESAQARLLLIDRLLSDREGTRDTLAQHLEDLLAIAEPNGMDWVVERARSYARIARIALEPASDSGEGPAAEAPQQLPHHLTAREVEVMSLLAEGLTNKGIGERLYVSPRTVSTHISNLLAKLGVSNRGEAAAAYHRLGLDQVIDLRDTPEQADAPGAGATA